VKHRFSQSLKKNKHVTQTKSHDSIAKTQCKIVVIWQDNQSGDFLRPVIEISL